MASGLRLLGAGNPPLHCFRLGLEFALSGRKEVDGMIAHHGANARSLGDQLGLPDAVLEALGGAYEQWDGRGWPGELKSENVPLAARLAQLGEFTEVALRIGGVEATKAIARKRAGKQFDPSLAALMSKEAEMILADLDSVGTWDAVIAAEPALGICLSGESLDAALLAAANVVSVIATPISPGSTRLLRQLSFGAERPWVTSGRRKFMIVPVIGFLFGSSRLPGIALGTGGRVRHTKEAGATARHQFERHGQPRLSQD